jgi:hypothetical protein
MKTHHHLCLLASLLCISACQTTAQKAPPAPAPACCQALSAAPSDSYGQQLTRYYTANQGDLSSHHNLNLMLQKYASQDLTPDQKHLVVSIATKQLIDALRQEKSPEAEAVFWHYINKLHPRIGWVEKVSDFASNALVLGIQHQKNTVIDAVFNQLLGPDFSVQQTNNALLAYNLASYYARSGQTDKLLSATERALALGQTAEQFRADSDFANYRKHTAFNRLLHEKSAAE